MSQKVFKSDVIIGKNIKLYREKVKCCEMENSEDTYLPEVMDKSEKSTDLIGEVIEPPKLRQLQKS